MAGEHSLPISPRGSKASKSSDLRGHSKFKLLTASENPVFLGNGKTLPVQTVYLIHFTTPGANEEFCQTSTGSEYSVFLIKICFGTDNRFASPLSIIIQI